MNIKEVVFLFLWVSLSTGEASPPPIGMDPDRRPGPARAARAEKVAEAQASFDAAKAASEEAAAAAKARRGEGPRGVFKGDILGGGGRDILLFFCYVFFLAGGGGGGGVAFGSFVFWGFVFCSGGVVGLNFRLVCYHESPASPKGGLLEKSSSTSGRVFGFSVGGSVKPFGRLAMRANE